MKRLGKLLKCFEYLVVAEKPRGSAVRAARPWNTLIVKLDMFEHSSLVNISILTFYSSNQLIRT